MKKYLLYFLFLSSCTLAPKYERETGALPTEWRVSTDENLALFNEPFWQKFEDEILNGLVDEALSYNQDLKVAIYTVKEFEAQYGIVSSKLYPQMSGSGQAERFKFSENFISTDIPGPSIGNNFGLLLNASYFADIWGKVRSASQASYAKLLAQIEVRRAIVLAVVTGVLKTYIKMRSFDEELRISLETLATRWESFNIAKVRFELGLTSEMQVEQAKSEVEDAQIEVDRFKIAIALQENLLSLLLGKPSNTPPRGKTIEELVIPKNIPSYLPSTMVTERPDVVKSEQDLISANANIGVARALFLPQFNILGDFGSQTSSLSNFFSSSSNIWQYGIDLFQEIFTGGRLTNQLKLAKATKLAMLHSYQQSILTGLKEINDSLVSHKISNDLTKEQKERVETLTAYFTLATDQYVEGLTDYLTYLDAERKLFQGQLAYAESLAYSLTTYVDIFQASGGGFVLTADEATLKANQ
ncbi:MAG: efflux transporter outer membrane subunit [Chlamydiae bacterium]|nr:efflux transporter outer membrane subunit [Chlamydiota bacterium]